MTIINVLLLETESFYSTFDFWIFLILTIIGITISYKSYSEAKSAKEAALEAGKTVKIQTIIIELTEVIQRLDKLNPTIKYSEARDLHNEIQRRVYRITAPFESDDLYKDHIIGLKGISEEIKTSLNSVRPTKPTEHEVGNAVYNAIESNFSKLSSSLANLVGLFEKRTINIG